MHSSNIEEILEKVLHQVSVMTRHIYSMEITQGKLYMQNQELFDAITTIQPTLAAATDRITAKIAELQATITATTTGDIPQPVVDAITAVQVSVAALNVLVP